jgi:hypothetical protein
LFPNTKRPSLIDLTSVLSRTPFGHNVDTMSPTLMEGNSALMSFDATRAGGGALGSTDGFDFGLACGLGLGETLGVGVGDRVFRFGEFCGEVFGERRLSHV